MYEQLQINGEIAYAYKHNPYYFVTCSGKIYSVLVKGGQGSVDYAKPRLLATSRDRYGYDRVVLSDHGIKQYLHVHTIVTEQFIGDVYKTGLTVNHKDGNKLNNHVDNLEIITSTENTRHAIKAGLRGENTPLRVRYQTSWFDFPTMIACNKAFPNLSLHYLQQLRNGIVTAKATQLVFGDHYSVSVYQNGVCVATVSSYTEADNYLGWKRGVTSGRAHGRQDYAERVNKYHVEFEGVSTIERAE